MSASCKWILNLHKRFPKSFGSPILVKDNESKSFIITYPILKFSSKRELWFLTLQVFKKGSKRLSTVKAWSSRDLKGKQVKNTLTKLFGKTQTFICIPDKLMTKFLRKIKDGSLTTDDLKQIVKYMIGSQKLTPAQEARLDKAIARLYELYKKLHKSKKFLAESKYTYLAEEADTHDADDNNRRYRKEKKRKSEAEQVVFWLKVLAISLSAISIMVAFFMLIVMFKLSVVIFKNMSSTVAEKLANHTENSLRRELFKGQTGKEEEFVKYYGELINWLEKLIQSPKINGLLVYGPPGTGKTYTINRWLYFHQDYIPYDVVYVKGSIDNSWQFYALLYKYRDKLIVLDDFDVEWDERFAGLLKAATDSYPKRVISWPKFKVEERISIGGFELKGVPDKFTFTGKIIAITNLRKEDIPKAVLSRMPSIEVKFDTKTLLQLIKDMLKYFEPELSIKEKQVILDYLVALYKQGKLKYLDLRAFNMAVSLYKLDKENWRQRLLTLI